MADVRFWPKQTCAAALHMSAFGGKADMTIANAPVLTRALEERFGRQRGLIDLDRQSDAALVFAGTVSVLAS
jgi:hypothetical protein